VSASAGGRGPRSRAVGWLADAVGGVAELVFAGGCAGCAAGGPAALCADCRGYLSGLHPYPTRPTPAPTGLPACHALGAYDGVLREALLGYKERGRYPLAGPLGALLADMVAAAVPDRSRPLLLVPVPDAPAAARERYGDHLRRLADRAARQLRSAGWSAAVAPVLAARPKADSAHLTRPGGHWPPRARSPPGPGRSPPYVGRWVPEPRWCSWTTS